MNNNGTERGSGMQDITVTIMEYKAGCAHIRERITQLGTQITTARKTGSPVKDLLDRRYLLYVELADMQYAIGRLEEYAAPASSRENAG